jgi:hypothetical protein
LKAIMRRGDSACTVATSAMRSSTCASPRADPSERGREVVAGAVGEESHVAKVDSEHRRVVRHRELERAQDGPVAAQRNDKVAVRRQAAGLGARARSTTSTQTSRPHASMRRS